MDDAKAQQIAEIILNPKYSAIKDDDFALAEAINAEPATVERGIINPRVLWDAIDGADYVALDANRRAALDGIMALMQIDMRSTGIRSALAAIFAGTATAQNLVDFQIVPSTLGENLMDGRRGLDHGDIKLARRYLIAKDLESGGVDPVVALKIGDEVINKRVELKDAATKAEEIASAEIAIVEAARG